MKAEDADRLSEALETHRRRQEYMEMKEVFLDWLLCMKIVFPVPNDFQKCFRVCTSFPEGRILDWILNPFTDTYENSYGGIAVTHSAYWSDRGFPHSYSERKIRRDDVLALSSQAFQVELTGEIFPGPLFPRLPKLHEIMPADHPSEPPK